MSTTQTPEYTITTGRGGVTILWQGQTFEVEVEEIGPTIGFDIDALRAKAKG